MCAAIGTVGAVSETRVAETDVLNPTGRVVVDSMGLAPPLQERFTPSQPTLPLPLILIQAIEDTEKAANALMKCAMLRLEIFNDKIASERALQGEKIQETSAKMSTSDTWSTLQDVAMMLTAAASMVVGGILMSSALPPTMYVGGALVGSGVATMAGMVMKRMGYSPYITGALGLTSAALSIAGGFYGAAQLSAHLPQMIMTIVNTGMGILTGVTSMGKGLSDADLKWLDAELMGIKHQIGKLENKIEDGTKDEVKAGELMAELQKACRRYLMLQSQVNKRITQGKMV